MIKWAIKKYVMGKVNDLLKEYKDDVNAVQAKLNTWITRLESVIAAFKKVNERIADGEITDQEVKESVTDVETVIKNW